jgi:1-acyl-sn-glycerol-3-phosphate acyltransferase
LVLFFKKELLFLSNHNDKHPVDARAPALLAAFRWYLHAFAWLRFAAVRLSCAGVPARHDGRPLIVYSNHPSWWDPAIYLIAGPKCFPGRRIFGPMAAAELQRWGFFGRLGVFGLEPGMRGAARFLRVAKQGLADPRAALWMTAEGAFTDARTRPVRLRPGIAHLARDLPGVILLPLALDYVFWNDSRPEALLRFGAPMTGGGETVAMWQARLEAALTATMDALTDDGISRDPARFTTLLAGATQTGLFFQRTWRSAT